MNKPIKPLASRMRPAPLPEIDPEPELDPDFNQLEIPQPLLVKFSTSPTLTFNDGLNFGCGFFVAGFLFSIAMIPISFILLSLF